MNELRQQNSVQEKTPESGLVLFLRDILVHKVLGLTIVLICLAIGLLSWLRSPTTYDARVTMLPNIQSVNSDLLGTLASFTGMKGLEESTYEQLYGEILKSDRVLNTALGQPWQGHAPGDTVGNLRALGLDPEHYRDNPARMLNKAKRLLRTQTIHFTREKFTGYMKLRVRLADNPQAAANLANILAEVLDNILEQLRLDSARHNQAFVRDRLTSVEAKLLRAEQALVSFKEQNRNYSSSPRLSYRFAEMRREVDALTSMWVTLKRELETAEIEVNKQNISLKILDRAEPPTLPSGPNALKTILLSFFVGVILAILGIFIKVQWPRFRMMLTS